jgi:hypothetical protein
MMLSQALVAMLLYPGLVWTLILGVVYTLLTQQSGQVQRFFPALLAPAAWRSGEGLLCGISVLLVAVGMAFVPWPLHPMQVVHPARWLLVWGGLEGAFLLALLPALIAGPPFVVRAAIREAQIGVAGRTLLWLALASSFQLANDWNLIAANGHSPLLVHVLAIVAAAFAFPVAVGWGPFGSETSITPGGTEQGLDQQTTHMARIARHVRMAGLLAVALVALLPLALVSPLVALGMLLGGFVLVSFILRRFSGVYPRMSLPHIFRMCWWRVVPPGVAAVIYLAVTLS